MTDQRATEDTLGIIHERMAQRFITILNGEPTAAELAVIAKFLKDNNITSRATADNTLGALIGKLQESMNETF